MNLYEQGNVVRVSVVFKNAAGVPTDPTAVTLRLRKPDTTVITYTYQSGAEIVRDSAGAFHADIVVNKRGTWEYKWMGTGAVVASDENSFEVAWSNFS